MAFTSQWYQTQFPKKFKLEWTLGLAMRLVSTVDKEEGAVQRHRLLKQYIPTLCGFTETMYST